MGFIDYNKIYNPIIEAAIRIFEATTLQQYVTTFGSL